MFKVEAKKTSGGAYSVQGTCSKGHTSFKKVGDRSPYSCPYCGHEVP